MLFRGIAVVTPIVCELYARKRKKPIRMPLFAYSRSIRRCYFLNRIISTAAAIENLRASRKSGGIVSVDCLTTVNELPHMIAVVSKASLAIVLFLSIKLPERMIRTESV